VRTVGCGPSAVALVERGSLPKTPSGNRTLLEVLSNFRCASAIAGTVKILV
jgi:hypothetical protein